MSDVDFEASLSVVSPSPCEPSRGCEECSLSGATRRRKLLKMGPPLLVHVIVNLDSGSTRY